MQDGLSTDGSVEGLTAGTDLKVFRERDEGIYDAMNRAVSHTEGKYLFFLNCGDYFADENVLAQVKREIEKHGGPGGPTSKTKSERVRAQPKAVQVKKNARGRWFFTAISESVPRAPM